MKSDMYIMESVNDPFAPCFRAAHTLRHTSPTSRPLFATLRTKKTGHVQKKNRRNDRLSLRR